MQRHLPYYFSSLTTDMNRFSENPRVLTVPQKGMPIDLETGVRIHCFFASSCLSIPFRLQSRLMATLKEGDPWQIWEFIPV